MKRITAVICAILSLSMLCSCQTLFETVAESNRQETSSFVESVESEELNNDRIELLDLDRDEIHPKIWKVESKDGKGGKLYLFGSIHIGVEEMFPLDDRIESAYEDSDAVAVEVDVISMEYGVNNLAEQYQKYLMYNDGTSLLNHISPETYSAVGQYLKKNHVSIYPYIGYKPYVLSEIVSSVKQKNSDKTAPYSSDYGIDRHYLTRAKLDGKQVLEVEDSKERLKMYGDYSDNVQEWLLLSALLSDTENFDGSIELLKQWAQGDLTELAASNDYNKTDEYKKLDAVSRKIYDEYNKGMMTDRNNIMVKKAEQYLKGDSTVMYIVGAAHMVGEDGIVNQLGKKGWKITEID